jgi:hypothetical protein
MSFLHAAGSPEIRRWLRFAAAFSFFTMPQRLHISVLAALVAALFLAGCSTTPPYRYRYRPGMTAIIQNDRAIPPANAPDAVRRVIQAGNEIIGRPYRRGGGHGRIYDNAYDCSGAASYVLIRAGLLDSPMPSTPFRRYGERGPGEWITVYARKGHVFLVIAGLRFDTGWGRRAHGPQWLTRNRPANGAVMRHPAGY